MYAQNLKLTAYSLTVDIIFDRNITWNAIVTGIKNIKNKALCNINS